MTLQQSFAATVVALVLTGHTAPASSSTELYVLVSGGAGSVVADEATFYSDSDVSSGPSLGLGGSAISPGGDSSTTCSVGFGWARGAALTSHSAPDEGRASRSGSSFSAQFRDDLTITAPGIGGVGTATFLIRVTGTLGVSTLDNAGHSVRADWVTGVSSTAAGLVELASGRISDDPGGSTQTGDPMGGMYEWGPVSFSFGAPFEVLVQFAGSSAVNFCCSAASNFGSTLTWEGVVEIRDAEGALVENFLIDSGSGEDYGTAIPAPEPASGQLGITALSVVALLARARSRCPRPKPTRGTRQARV